MLLLIFSFIYTRSDKNELFYEIFEEMNFELRSIFKRHKSPYEISKNLLHNVSLRYCININNFHKNFQDTILEIIKFSRPKICFII